MAHSIHEYARALSDLIHEKQVERSIIETGFIELLKKNNDLSKLSQILEETEDILHTRNGTHKVVITSARPISPKSQKHITESFPSSDTLIWEIDPRLIAGITITVNDTEELDMSLSNKLNKLFAR